MLAYPGCPGKELLNTCFGERADIVLFASNNTGSTVMSAVWCFYDIMRSSARKQWGKGWVKQTSCELRLDNTGLRNLQERTDLDRKFELCML